MQMQDIKDGMRVYWDGGDYLSPDSGTVLLNYKDRYELPYNSVWVKWDSDGEILHAKVEDLSAESIGEATETAKETEKEQEAVMLLLSLGYTVSKFE